MVEASQNKAGANASRNKVGPISRELVRLLIGGGALRILMFSLYTTVLALAILSMETALIFFEFIL